MRRALIHFGPTAFFVGASVLAVHADLYDLAIYSAFAASVWSVIVAIRTVIQGGDNVSPPSLNRGRPRPTRRMPNIITGGIR